MEKGQTKLTSRGDYLLPFVVCVCNVWLVELSKTVILGPFASASGRPHRPIAITVCRNYVFVQARGAGCSDETGAIGILRVLARKSVHRNI